MSVRRAVAAALLAGLLAGCGGGPRLVKVRGTLLEKGAPYRLQGDEILVVEFVPAGGGPKATRYAVHLAADGSFTVRGPDGEGLPPGSYAVYATSGVEGQGWKEKFKGRFAAGKSPLRFEVPDVPEQRVIIDLAAGTVQAS
jgi:hypothetical protein